MPWLIQSTKSNPIPLPSHLFFIHVPRCGGTSLMTHFDIPQKVLNARGPLRQMAMRYFFLRYKTLESANFPIKTKENGACLVLLVIAWAVRSVALAGLAIGVSLFTTVVCTAPVIGRITPVHRWYLWWERSVFVSVVDFTWVLLCNALTCIHLSFVQVCSLSHDEIFGIYRLWVLLRNSVASLLVFIYYCWLVPSLSASFCPAFDRVHWNQQVRVYYAFDGTQAAWLWIHYTGANGQYVQSRECLVWRSWNLQFVARSKCL